MIITYFIPTKNSERIPGENFCLINGEKLYEYINEHILHAVWEYQRKDFEGK